MFILNETELARIAQKLARRDSHLRTVHKKYGPPPLWDRPAGFATLLKIILEQQVSLASAQACFDKLSARLGSVTPDELLKLADSELKTIGFSRQKSSYARHLAEALVEGRIDLERLAMLPDADARAELIKLKGVGEWTADIYLLMALLRPDVMPRGDLALHVSWQKLSDSTKRPTPDEFLAIAERWAPYRSVAARLLWHFYLSERRRVPQRDRVSK